MKSACHLIIVRHVLLLALTAAAAAAFAAEPVVYIEPMTGTRILLPPEFAINTTEGTQPGQYGMVHYWVINPMQDDSVQFNVGVNEIRATSMAEVLEGILFRPDETASYAILELSANHIKLDEEKESFGKKEFRRHWAWLLEDGSYLYALLSEKNAIGKRFSDAVAITFGSDADEKSISLIGALPAPDRGKAPLAGDWRNTENGIRLQVYGDSLLDFRAADGASLAAGYLDAFWGNITFWDAVSGNASPQKGDLKTETPEALSISGHAALNGRYERLPEAAHADLKPPARFAGDHDFLGEWENDTEYCTLRITRASVEARTNTGFQQFSGYDATPEGLRLGSDVSIRPVTDGGIVMDGYAGVFYRSGTGRGADRFAEFRPYNGDWINEKAGISFSVKDGGIAYARGDTFGFGACSVDEYGYLVALDSRGRIMPESGRLVFEGMEGAFIRRAGSEDAPEDTRPSSRKEEESAPTYELSAEDADLSDAPDLILEPDTPPHNLGGWLQQGNNVAAFHFTVEVDGLYAAKLWCSREISGSALVLLDAGDGEGRKTTVHVPNTGTWSTYGKYDAATPLRIPAGKATLRVMTADPSRGSYLINLRSIQLRLQK